MGRYLRGAHFFLRGLHNDPLDGFEELGLAFAEGLVFVGVLRDLFLDRVEVVDDDSDEEVESEEGPADDESEEEEVVFDAVLSRRLFSVVIRHVHGLLHHLHPAFEQRLKHTARSLTHSLTHSICLDTSHNKEALTT